MSADQITILLILLATVGLFVWGRFRHDLVAAAALLTCVLFGLVPGGEAFEGFGHPAVITVACVLILSRALQVTGAVDLITDRLLPKGASAWLATSALVILAAVLSAFMNNVGALALLMPVAVQLAQRHGLPPGQVLMPVAFGSILGGMTTLIGTPPNLIVSGFRADAGLGSFSMFDFTPVGLAVAVVGVTFTLMAGRWLIPVRERSDLEDFDIGSYLTEARVQADSKSVGLRLAEAERRIDESGAQVVGVIRNDERLRNPHGNLKLRAADILVIEAEPKALMSALNQLDIQLEEDKQETPVPVDPKDEQPAQATEVAPDARRKDARDDDHKDKKDQAEEQDRSESKGTTDDEEITLLEVVVMPMSSIIGRSARSLRLRSRHAINLLAVSRQGRRTTARLRTLQFRPGDVLLMQGARESLTEFAVNHGCVPLAERALRIPRTRQALIAGLVMLAAVVGAAFGLLPAAITFAAGVVVIAATRVIPPRKIYDAIDWPVIILLASMIPIGDALQTTGLTTVIAGAIAGASAQHGAIAALLMVFLVTMLATDILNNAATVVIMAPIGAGVAHVLGANPDTFLMAVAIGGSCAFLTPIGHQNNTLIMGPGGYNFGDYWRMGLPLQFIIVVTAIPLLLYFWPL